MHPQFSYGAGNTDINDFDIQATATPSIIPPIPNQMDSPRASSSLQQQPDLSQSDFPSYSMPLEQSAYPHQLSAAEPSNKDFLGHFNPVTFDTISPAQDHFMASTFDSEEVPQGWLWDAYQRAAMDSMLLDRARREQEQQHCLPLVHTPGLSSSHSTTLPSGLYASDSFWHSNALELASRAAALASAPLMSIASAAPLFILPYNGVLQLIRDSAQLLKPVKHICHPWAFTAEPK
ncbi:hypothetical protein EC957_012095 [Mortierella hygrophila]|uniref:Uncharacterized protein n=1 Tax=Mortierella hygrophila TaxID=979708 RepID=A0A9P6F7X2_9FUNG|nr:hypothetical protein EC957_012095 [Mortierella hygrophila]